MNNLCLCLSESVSIEPSLALLPKRGPEPLMYIPLGQKRRHPDEEAESQPKRVKKPESLTSESTDGFIYMGKMVKLKKLDKCEIYILMWSFSVLCPT